LLNHREFDADLMLQKLTPELRWGLLFPVICLNGWLFLQVLNQLDPLGNAVILAALFAYLFNYPIRFLQGLGLRRRWAILLVVAIAFIAISILAATIIPVLFQQAYELLDKLPTWIDLGKQQLIALSAWVKAKQWPVELSGLANQLTGQLSGRLQDIGLQVVDVASSAANSVATLFLTAIFTIVLSLTGEDVWNGLLSWLPDAWREQVRSSWQQTFDNFISGQLILATIQTILQTTAFLLLRVPFGLLFGVLVGILSLIPFGGALAVLVLGGLLMIQNVWLGLKVVLVSFLINQVNDNVIAPRILSGLVGLNPFWLIVSLFIGAKVAGTLGLFLAVPIASFIKTFADESRKSIPSTKADLKM
jgi:predicted PurR-regulated permease PerM